jgi:hypothetical protein
VTLPPNDMAAMSFNREASPVLLDVPVEVPPSETTVVALPVVVLCPALLAATPRAIRASPIVVPVPASVATSG